MQRIAGLLSVLARKSGGLWQRTLSSHKGQERAITGITGHLAQIDVAGEKELLQSADYTF
jgi:hypothetical protein